MLLDEPFTGVDPIAVGDIQALVRHLTGLGIGVLITDHNVRETLGLIDRAYIIHSGEVLFEGRPGRDRATARKSAAFTLASSLAFKPGARYATKERDKQIPGPVSGRGNRA